MLLAAKQAAVIDWAGATRGVPEADHARTLLLLRWADPLPGTSLVSRGLIAAGRSLLARAYARTYCGGSPPSPDQDAFLVVHAAAGLSEGIPIEHATQVALLDRARREARH